MATLSITKDWADGTVLLEADLDNIKDDVETFLNTTQLNDDNLQNAGITASTKLIDASISTAKLANLSVTTAKIDDLAVTTGKIAANAVTTAKITDANVTKAKLATAARDGTAANKTTDVTLTLAEDLITVDSSGGIRTIMLPPSSTSSGHEYTIVKTSSSNTVVIDANASELINGALTLTLNAQYESATIFCDGSSWYLRSRYIPGSTFNPVRVSARRTSSLSLTEDTTTVVPFPTEVVDSSSAYNSATGVFTTPFAGEYLLSSTLAFVGTTSATAHTYYMGYRLNGSTVVKLDELLGSNVGILAPQLIGVKILSLAAADTIEIVVFSDTDSAVSAVSSSEVNSLTIVRVA